MPTTIRSFTAKDKNDDFNVYINCRLSKDRQLIAYTHELRHIMHDDFTPGNNVDTIESMAHK